MGEGVEAAAPSPCLGLNESEHEGLMHHASLKHMHVHLERKGGAPPAVPHGASELTLEPQVTRTAVAGVLQTRPSPAPMPAFLGVNGMTGSTLG